MPITKQATIVNSSGGSPSVSGSYWTTRGVYISPDYSGVRATMALFTSRAAFLAGQHAVHEADFILSGPANPLSLSALTPLVEASLIANIAQFVSGTPDTVNHPQGLNQQGP